MEWDPSRFFRPEGSPSPYALLILNQPINEKAFGVLSKYGKFLYECFKNSMSKIRNTNTHAASYIICADGGANRLFDMPEDNETESKQVSDIYGLYYLCTPSELQLKNQLLHNEDQADQRDSFLTPLSATLILSAPQCENTMRNSECPSSKIQTNTQQTSPNV